MRDVNRLTVDEFFAWQRLVEGRYELLDGRIVANPTIRLDLDAVFA